MWYEIIPAAAIITISLSIPGYAIYGLNKLVLGNAYKRNKEQRWDRYVYQRDVRLTGDAYKGNGLETIND